MQEGTLELTLTERFTFKTRRGLRLFTKDSGRDFPLEGAAVDAADVGLTGYSDLVACASEVGADDRALIGRLPEPFETSLAHVAAALDLQRGSGKKALLAGSRSNVFFVGGTPFTSATCGTGASGAYGRSNGIRSSGTLDARAYSIPRHVSPPKRAPGPTAAREHLLVYCPRSRL